MLGTCYISLSEYYYDDSVHIIVLYVIIHIVYDNNSRLGLKIVIL